MIPGVQSRLLTMSYMVLYNLFPLVCPLLSIALVPSLFFIEIQLIPASGPFGLLTVLLGLVFPQMRICLLHLSAQVDSPMYPSVPNTQLCFYVFKMKKARQAI